MFDIHEIPMIFSYKNIEYEKYEKFIYFFTKVYVA